MKIIQKQLFKLLMAAAISAAQSSGALAQPAGPAVQVALVRQDFSDCGNNTVAATDLTKIDGRVSILQNAGGATVATVDLWRAAPNTLYSFFLKCDRQLGTVLTDAAGVGTASFSFRSAPSAMLTFDMYPAGAPAGNKYQSVKMTPATLGIVGEGCTRTGVESACLAVSSSPQETYNITGASSPSPAKWRRITFTGVKRQSAGSCEGTTLINVKWAYTQGAACLENPF